MMVKAIADGTIGKRAPDLESDSINGHPGEFKRPLTQTDPEWLIFHHSDIQWFKREPEPET